MESLVPLFVDAAGLNRRSVRATVYSYYYAPRTGPI